MRRFLSLAFACTFIVIASFASAQHVDVAIGGNTLWSPKNTTASEAFNPPPLKGGTYPSASLEYIEDNHFGLNVEGAFRYHYGIYNDFQTFRPIIYDVNAVYAPRMAHKTTGDFMAGIGGQTLIFYNQFYNCAPNAVNCRMNENSNHFLFHASAGIRYNFWRSFYIRPEAHWYYVVNNVEFHSNNLFRIGVSVGYVFGQKRPAKTVAPAPTPAPAPAPAPTETPK